MTLIPWRRLPRLIVLSSMVSCLLSCSVGPSSEAGTDCGNSRFSVDTHFVGARGASCRVTGDSSASVVIQPEDAPPINNSPWYAIKLSGSPGQKVVITVKYENGTHRYVPKISDDGQRWQLLDEQQVAVSADKRQAVLTLTIPPSTQLTLAAQPIISPQDVGKWARELAAQTPAQLSVLGYSALGREIVQLRSGSDLKDVLLLVGRQHPPETTGFDAYQAFVRTVYGQSQLATEFRERFAIIAVPMLNPDGIALGHWRHNTGGKDLNRDWGPFTQPETQLMQQLLDELEQSGRHPRLFLDFHATWRNLFYTQSDANPTWPLQFASHWLDAARPQLKDYPFTQEKSRRSTQPNSKNYMYGRYGIPAITYEVGDATPPAISAAAAEVFAREAMKQLLASASVPPHYDVILRNGLIIDGSGRPPYRGDVAIANGRIASLQPPPGATAERNIGVDGLWVTPGFIDPHTHASQDLANDLSRRNEHYLRQGVTSLFVGNDGGGLASRAKRLARIDAIGSGPNVGFFAGHGRIREAVMGRDNRPPTEPELAQMQTLVEAEMSAGALGLSSGLYYVPGSYSDTTELVALASAASKTGGVYDTHMRSESAVGLIDAVTEALAIGRQANIPVHISHLKALGSKAWGNSKQLVAMVNAAREEGQKISANQYPFEASGTRFSNALIPRSLMEGSREKMRARLRDPAVLAANRPEMLAALARRGGPEAMLITGSNSANRGKTLGQAARDSNRDPLAAAIHEILHGDPAIASFVMNLEDINRLAIQPWLVTGSDGSEGHPRKFATYPKAYQDFVVRRQLMSKERFVRRSSGQVADIFGLCDRGYLAAGLAADVAVIDPAEFVPRASYQNPTELSTGVRYLLVNGVLVIDESVTLEKTAGTVIRKNALEC
ncbi:MAG: M14 family zinc carboxypeptidase [Lysobacterales bacterium]